MGKICYDFCYDCATEKVDGICPNCYPDDVNVEALSSRIKELEEKMNWRSFWDGYAVGVISLIFITTLILVLGRNNKEVK